MASDANGSLILAQGDSITVPLLNPGPAFSPTTTNSYTLVLSFDNNDLFTSGDAFSIDVFDEPGDAAAFDFFTSAHTSGDEATRTAIRASWFAAQPADFDVVLNFTATSGSMSLASIELVVEKSFEARSQFAVVPEPTSLLLLISSVPLLIRRNRA